MIIKFIFAKLMDTSKRSGMFSLAYFFSKREINTRIPQSEKITV
jgi:hypothetical protein